MRLYRADWIKWYQDYEIVQEVTDYLEELGDEEDWLFIRIGEEIEDMEFLGNAWENPFNLQLLRNIHYDD